MHDPLDPTRSNPPELPRQDNLLPNQPTDAPAPEPAEPSILPNQPTDAAPTPTTEQLPDWTEPQLDVRLVRTTVEMVKEQIRKVIVGQEEMLDLLLIALFTNGHVLIEGVPGVAKTLTAKMLARTVELPFSRIQFTPDLMPSDVVGTTVFNVKESEFFFAPGPVFASVVLIDEINRAPAKTQSALFEVMEEAQVTVDGTTYDMEQPFLVLATQNPIEQEGTYKLPEAQLDRFLFKIDVDYPSLAEEQTILRRFRRDFQQTRTEEVQPVTSGADILRVRALIERVQITDALLDYIAEIIHTTRRHPDLYLGASPRASLAVLRASKAVAAMQGRDFVTPDDIQYVARPVLNHRVVLTPEREMEGTLPEEVLGELVRGVAVPR